MSDATARRPRPPPSPAFRSTRSTFSVLAAFLFVASAAVAGVLLSYNTSSTAALAIKPPPIVWSAGPDSSGNNFVSSWSLSANATYWSLTLKPVPEANITWENLTTLTNQDSAADTIAVTGTDLSGYSKVLAARLEFYAYGTNTLVGSMDLKNGASVSLGSMAAGASYYVKAYVKLDTNTGQQDLPSDVSISVSITP